MRYKYHNVVTGAEFESNSRISARNWELVGADDPVIIPATEPADPDPVIPDPEEDYDEDLADFDDIIPEVVEEKPKPKAKKTVKKPAKKGAKK